MIVGVRGKNYYLFPLQWFVWFQKNVHYRQEFATAHELEAFKDFFVVIFIITSITTIMSMLNF